jgi:hypothetical protein
MTTKERLLTAIQKLTDEDILRDLLVLALKLIH